MVNDLVGSGAADGPLSDQPECAVTGGAFTPGAGLSAGSHPTERNADDRGAWCNDATGHSYDE